MANKQINVYLVMKLRFTITMSAFANQDTFKMMMETVYVFY